MKRLRKIYYFAVLGALGGAVAAALHQILLLDLSAKPLASFDHRLYDVFLGLAIGAPIGFFPNLLQGLSRYSAGRALRSGLLGASLAGVGGMLVVPISEMLHSRLGGGIPGRAAAVGLLGIALGVAEALTGGARWWRSLVGGFIGGFAAGALLEALLQWQATYSDSAIVVLILLGLAISLSIALFVNVLSEVWFEGLPGSKIAGQVYQLSRFQEPAEAILGSDRKGRVFIWIPDAQPRHASITVGRGRARLRHLSELGETLVNGHPVQESPLRDGDIIQIGSSRLCFRQQSKGDRRPTGIALNRDKVGIAPSTEKFAHVEPVASHPVATAPALTPMGDLNLEVTTPQGNTHRVEAAADINGGEFLKGLINLFRLPTTDAEGRPIDWRVDNKDTGRRLDVSRNLADNGIREGHHLHIVRQVSAGHPLRAGAGSI